MAIPLREYYTLSRAAELLDCKVNDLIHWAFIGVLIYTCRLSQVWDTCTSVMKMMS